MRPFFTLGCCPTIRMRFFLPLIPWKYLLVNNAFDGVYRFFRFGFIALATFLLAVGCLVLSILSVIGEAISKLISLTYSSPVVQRSQSKSSSQELPGSLRKSRRTLRLRDGGGRLTESPSGMSSSSTNLLPPFEENTTPPPTRQSPQREEVDKHSPLSPATSSNPSSEASPLDDKDGKSMPTIPEFGSRSLSPVWSEQSDEQARGRSVSPLRPSCRVKARFQRRLSDRSSKKTSSPRRTDPYQPPYNFPFPGSPEAIDYAHRVRLERMAPAFVSSPSPSSSQPSSPGRSSPVSRRTTMSPSSPTPATRRHSSSAFDSHPVAGDTVEDVHDDHQNISFDKGPAARLKEEHRRRRSWHLNHPIRAMSRDRGSFGVGGSWDSVAVSDHSLSSRELARMPTSAAKEPGRTKNLDINTRATPLRTVSLRSKTGKRSSLPDRGSSKRWSWHDMFSHRSNISPGSTQSPLPPPVTSDHDNSGNPNHYKVL
ncbi:hypothetical protein ABKN59_008496 [Abortiporus biennis]